MRVGATGVALSLATTLLATTGVASAATFTYGSYSVVNEINVTIGESNSTGIPPGYETGYFGSGQIVLHGTGPNAGQMLNVWCIDATHDLQWSDTDTFIHPNPSLSNNGGAPGGSQLSLIVLGEIGALVDWGDANINKNYYNSAAVQLAIWSIEYPGGTFVSDSGNVNTLVKTLIADAENQTNGFSWSTNLFEVIDPKDNQGLIGATPLPSTWTMMLIGLAGLGLLTYHRRRRVGTVAV